MYKQLRVGTRVKNRDTTKIKEEQKQKKEKLLEQFKARNLEVVKEQKPKQAETHQQYNISKKKVKKTNTEGNQKNLQEKLNKTRATIKEKNQIILDNSQEIQDLKQQLNIVIEKNKVLQQEKEELLVFKEIVDRKTQENNQLKVKNKQILKQMKDWHKRNTRRVKSINDFKTAIIRKNRLISELYEQINWDKVEENEKQISNIEENVREVYLDSLEQYKERIEELKNQLYTNKHKKKKKIKKKVKYKINTHNNFLAQIFIGDKNQVYIKNKDGEIMDYTRIFPYSFEHGKVMAVCKKIGETVNIIQLYPECRGFDELINALLGDTAFKSANIKRLDNSKKKVQKEYKFKIFNGEKVIILTRIIKMANLYSNVFKMSNLNIDFLDPGDEKNMGKISKLGQYDIVINHTGTTPHKIKEAIFSTKWYKCSEDTIYDEMEDLTLNRLMQRINYLISNRDSQ